MANANGTGDSELLQRIAAKDRVAVEVLYGRYNVRLFRFILRLVRNEALAEELANETFMEIWQVAGKFEGRSVRLDLDFRDRPQQGYQHASQALRRGA